MRTRTLDWPEETQTLLPHYSHFLHAEDREEINYGIPYHTRQARQRNFSVIALQKRQLLIKNQNFFK